MPVPLHCDHRVTAVDTGEQQGRDDKPGKGRDDDPPGRNTRVDQHGGAKKAGDGRGFCDRALYLAAKRLHPRDAAIAYALHAVDGGNTQRCRAAVAVDWHPDRVAGHLHRVGEIQERAADQRRVEEVLAGAAEHFLADHDAEADAERHLPERCRRGQDRRVQERGDEEAFVDLVIAHARKQNFPESAGRHRHDVDRQEVQQAVQEIVVHARRVRPGTQ